MFIKESDLNDAAGLRHCNSLVCRAWLQTWDKLEGGFGAESPGSAGPPGDSLGTWHLGTEVLGCGLNPCQVGATAVNAHGAEPSCASHAEVLVLGTASQSCSGHHCRQYLLSSTPMMERVAHPHHSRLE